MWPSLAFKLAMLFREHIFTFLWFVYNVYRVKPDDYGQDFHFYRTTKHKTAA